MTERVVPKLIGGCEGSRQGCDEPSHLIQPEPSSGFWLRARNAISQHSFVFHSTSTRSQKQKSVKLRGMAYGPMVDANFFLILDRLRTTLDEKKVEWSELRTQLRKQDRRSWRKKLLGKSSKQMSTALRELTVHRMTVAYDIASALCYLHDHR